MRQPKPWVGTQARARKGKALCVTGSDVTPHELLVLLPLEAKASLTWELLHLLSKLPSSPGVGWFFFSPADNRELIGGSCSTFFHVSLSFRDGFPVRWTGRFSLCFLGHRVLYILFAHLDVPRLNLRGVKLCQLSLARPSLPGPSEQGRAADLLELSVLSAPMTLKQQWAP